MRLVRQFSKEEYYNLLIFQRLLSLINKDTFYLLRLEDYFNLLIVLSFN